VIGSISAYGYGRLIITHDPGLLCPTELVITELAITEEELAVLLASEYAPVLIGSEDEVFVLEPTHTAPLLEPTDALVADMTASEASLAQMTASHRALEAFEITEEAPVMAATEEDQAAFDTLTELASVMTPDHDPGEC